MLSKIEVIAPAIRSDPEKLNKAIAMDFVFTLGPHLKEKKGLLSTVKAVDSEQLVRGHQKS